MDQVQVKPELLSWARERAGITVEELLIRFPKFDEWERNDSHPTLKQLEKFAKATHAPIGYFFLPNPPIENIPIPDFRTINDQRIIRPSPNLLEMLYVCQQRQAWYFDYARSARLDPLEFVGSANLGSSVEEVAEQMRQILHFDLEERRACPTWSEALRKFIIQSDDLGVMVMCSGVVLNNNRRRLNPSEFRGFAIVDKLAPLVFVNGADTKAAQMFTLAHELAHLWLGESALSNSDVSTFPGNEIEGWCNRVAAEMLVPMKVLRDEFRNTPDLSSEINRLARCFKVSTLVILRRVFDMKMLSREKFKDAYNAELERLSNIDKGSGGNFYLTQAARSSKRFVRALVESTLEGTTLYRDALRMLGISKISTFNKIGQSLG